jgi:glycosyltransferase involved in cell wall biosynthesis
MIQVLHVTPHGERCGIGKYQEMFVDALRRLPDAGHEYFATTPGQLRSATVVQRQAIVSQFRTALAKYDIVHFQHEFSFFAGRDFLQLVCEAQSHGKKTIVTVHTSPKGEFVPPRLTALSRQGISNYFQQRRRFREYRRTFLAAIKQVDRILVHNPMARDGLIDEGVDRENIVVIQLPVPTLDHQLRSDVLKEFKLPGDIVFAVIGFVSDNKGIDHAIKALHFLPANYKLAVVGGVHPQHDGVAYQQVVELIVQRGLQARVHITGYIEDDSLLNAVVRECDLCVFPYARRYYARNSSASLNNAFANHKPIIAYPTDVFNELQQRTGALVTCQSFNYYDLAREILRLNHAEYCQRSARFADEYSYAKAAANLAIHYAELSRGSRG